MADRKKSPRPHSPTLTLALVLVAAVAAALVFNLLLQGLSNSNQPPSFVSGAAATLAATSVATSDPASTELASATEIVISSTPLYSTPEPTYVVGPTAQYDQVRPIEQWNTFESEQVKFTIAYPPDWYVNGLAPELGSGGFSVQFTNFDPRDPTLIEADSGRGEPHPNYASLDITVDSPILQGNPLSPDEPLASWVTRTKFLPADAKVVDEKSYTIDERGAYHRIVQLKHDLAIAEFYVKSGENIIEIIYRTEPQVGANAEILQKMVESLSFLK